MTQPPMKTDALDRLQEDTLGYFLKEANCANGMVPDNTRTGAHASIAAIGFDSGFIQYRWEGYSEALILYVLGLASPTHPLRAESYRAWTETYCWKTLYGYEFLYAGPLFIHQLSHLWIDFPGIQDDFMRAREIDYFENSRRATYVQQQYAIQNPLDYRGYGENCWGITASDGPGPTCLRIEGVERYFEDYTARGVPYGPDDGTIAPWAAVASLPFAPEIVLPPLQHFNDAHPEMTSESRRLHGCLALATAPA
jgi:hypothetical protein